MQRITPETRIRIMNEELQRIKIAEACEWKIESLSSRVSRGNYNPTPCQDVSLWWSCMRPDGSCVGTSEGEHPLSKWLIFLPDYLSDLNACAEMVRGISIHHQDQFSFELWAIIRRDRKASETEVGSADFLAVNATSPQRCEAFLRTLGLWQEPLNREEGESND